MFPILNPPPSPYHPSGSFQCTSPKHPVLCIEPGRPTCFIHDILHVSMPLSQIFPPSRSPTESKRLFYIYISVSFAVSYTGLLLLLVLLSHFSRVRLCVTPLTAAHQAPPSLGFSRQEHWSGLSFPSRKLNLHLVHCRQILYCLSHQGSPRILEWVACPFSRRSSLPRN